MESLGAPGPDDEDGGDHGAEQAWVACPRRNHLIAADPLGPVIAHGWREAPGYRPRLLDPAQRQFLKRASLQIVPLTNGLVWTKLTLPDADPPRERLARLIDGAIRVTGKRVPAEVRVEARREIRDDGDTLRRIWDVAFRHQGVRVSPGRCQLQVEAGSTAAATLACRLPEGDAPLAFGRFAIADDVAIQTAVETTEVEAVSVDVRRLFEATGGSTAAARIQVVHSDGRVERLTVLDGFGAVMSSGSNEREFTFDGYDLDYLNGLKRLSAPVQVGFGQTEVLDSADFAPGKESCPEAQVPAVEKYARGFVVCRNDIYFDKITQTLSQAVVAPRPDNDFTNPANTPVPPALSVDPLGPQLMLFNQNLDAAPLVHGTLTNVPARPRAGQAFLDYVRASAPAEQPIGPAHHAELQLFYTAGKLQDFYSLLDPRFRVGGQDRFRTTLRAHWRGAATGEEPVDENLGGRAGRFGLKISDWSPEQISGVPQLEPYAFDGTSEGSIVAHEYHHHIQESLAVDDGWLLLPSQGVLFPEPSPDSLCAAPNQQNCRRAQILEGAADGFAALAVGRGVLGTLAASKTPLGEMLELCADNQAYVDMVIPGGMGARVNCTNRVFGYWQEGPGSGAAPCARLLNESAKKQYGLERRAVASGALYAFQRRFLDSGAGTFSPAHYLLEGQRALQRIEDNEVIYLSGLVEYLRGSPTAAIRRYEYTARAAFAEKGVFSAWIHVATMLSTGGDLDVRPIVRCDGCPLPVEISAQTLVMSGPFEWSSEIRPPQFDVFAPPGSSYEKGVERGVGNVVHLEPLRQPGVQRGAGRRQRHGAWLQLDGARELRTSRLLPNQARRRAMAGRCGVRGHEERPRLLSRETVPRRWLDLRREHYGLGAGVRGARPAAGRVQQRAVHRFAAAERLALALAGRRSHAGERALP